MEDVFELKILSRSGKVYEGDVKAITSYNDKGKFDVLAQHANFISLISKSLTILEISGQKRTVSFDNALIRVKENFVEVYVGVEGLGPSNLPE